MTQLTTRRATLDDLYREEGCYSYRSGWNMAAVYPSDFSRT